MTPESDSLNQGFIVTGFGKGDGLYRCVISELPTRPLQSLAELQNWDLRYENPVPPFAFNLIGNSDATPLIAANSVIGDYPVNLNFRAPGDARLNPLCETKWQYDAGTRTVLFVINQQGARIPRVLGFPDYRAEEKADTP